MALSSKALAQLAMSKYKSKMSAAFPDVSKGGTVTQIPKEDGSVEYQVTVQRGPMEIDEAAILPLLESLAEAFVEHIKSSGEAIDVSAGQNWRIS